MRHKDSGDAETGTVRCGPDTVVFERGGRRETWKIAPRRATLRVEAASRAAGFQRLPGKTRSPLFLARLSWLYIYIYMFLYVFCLICSLFLFLFLDALLRRCPGYTLTATCLIQGACVVSVPASASAFRVARLSVDGDPAAPKFVWRAP